MAILKILALIWSAEIVIIIAAIVAFYFEEDEQ